MLKESEFVSLRVYVPLTHADAVRKAMGDAGAGKIGNYSHCSGSVRVSGRFIPLEGANPTIGHVGEPEVVEEEMIQTVCHKDVVEKVMKAVHEAHPYEEPAIDIFPRLEVV